MKSKTTHLATIRKVKSRGIKGDLFLVCFLSTPTQQGVTEGGMGCVGRGNKNLCNARGSERFASKQGLRKLGNKDSNLQELMELETG